MKLPNWLAWPFIRFFMEIAVLKLRWHGMEKTEARRLVVEETIRTVRKMLVYSGDKP